MGTKIKGIFKGLRYISQIFDAEKEQEMQIGYPTDVKHVAHIGWDGPSAVHSPSWMNEFRSPGFSSAPASPSAENRRNTAAKSVSEDPSRRGTRNLPELPKSSRRQFLSEITPAIGSPNSDSSGKSRHSLRFQSASASNSPAREPCTGRGRGRPDGGRAAPTNPQELPKRSRRKKSKDSGTGSVSSRSRARAQPAVTYTTPFSDPGSGQGHKTDDPEFYPKSPLERRKELVG